MGDIATYPASWAPLQCSMASLASLNIYNFDIYQLDDLSSFSNLRQLELGGFDYASSVGPVSCLTLLTRLVLSGFVSLDSLVPLHALSRLLELRLSIDQTHFICLQPLCHLTSLTKLMLHHGVHCKTGYDLQPLSALSRTLQELELVTCVLENLPSITTLSLLSRLTLVGCDCEPGALQRAPVSSFFASWPGLRYLDIEGATAADLDAIGQQLTGLEALRLESDITSLAALATLTSLRFVSLENCDHIRSTEPLAELTGLQILRVHNCWQLRSLGPLTALQSLQQLRLDCCHLAATLPSNDLQDLVIMEDLVDEMCWLTAGAWNRLVAL
jgi:hypothetical protein